MPHPEIGCRQTCLRYLVETADKIAKTTAETHEKFLDFSNEITRAYGKTFALQTKLLERAIDRGEESIPHSLRGVGPDNPYEPEAAFRIPHFKSRSIPAGTALNLPQVPLPGYWGPNLPWLTIIRPECGCRMSL